MASIMQTTVLLVLLHRRIVYKNWFIGGGPCLPIKSTDHRAFYCNEIICFGEQFLQAFGCSVSCLLSYLLLRNLLLHRVILLLLAIMAYNACSFFCLISDLYSIFFNRYSQSDVAFINELYKLLYFLYVHKSIVEIG